MIINSLTIHNYKNFFGENKLELVPESKNGSNIILIGGLNGAGKSTLLEAIRICLFGKKFSRDNLSNKNYKNFLISAKNKKSNKNNDPLFYIKTEINLNEYFPPFLLELKREWFFNGDQIEEKFSIYREGSPLEIVPKEYWEDYILSIIPPYVTDYFFFDGEKVKELSITDNSEKVLSDAIRDLIGLNLFRNLNNDLGTLIKKIRHRNIKNLDVRKEIEKYEKDYLKIKEHMNYIDDRIIKNNTNIDKLSSKYTKIEEDLKRNAGIFAIERNKNQDNLLKIKEDLNLLEEEIKSICSEVLPFIMASRVCKELLKQLEKEKKIKELLASKKMLTELKNNLQKRLEAKEEIRENNKELMNLINNEIDEIFFDIFAKLQDNSDNYPIHDLTNAEIDIIENFVKKNEKNLTNKLKKILTKREEYLLNIKKINEKIKDVPDDNFIDDYIKTISSIKTKIELLSRENESLESEKNSFNLTINNIQEAINNFEEKVICEEKDDIKITISLKIQKMIKEFTDKIIDNRIGYLEKLITFMFKELANKEDLIKETKINKNDFSLKLIDYDCNIIKKENISEGEKEIFGLSILWGLSKISNKKLPIIIDTPLAKLDSKHRNNIITKFFPNAGMQVILLSHDKEIDSEAYLKIKSKVCRSYTLTFNDNEKIKNGYFTWG